MARIGYRGEQGMTFYQRGVLLVTPGDGLGPGWASGQVADLELTERLVMDPNYRSKPITRRQRQSGRYTLFDRWFGSIGTWHNFLFKSEDTVAMMSVDRAMLDLGKSPRRIVAWAIWQKSREAGPSHALLAARLRWASGLYQYLASTMVRLLTIFGSSSYYAKEGRSQGENFYLLAPEMTANVVFLSLLIIMGWMPFVGVDAAFYVIGLVANQVLRIQGLWGDIDASGPVSGTTRWFRDYPGDLTVFPTDENIKTTGAAMAATMGRGNHYDFDISVGASLESDEANKLALEKVKTHNSRGLSIIFWEQMVFGAIYVGLNIYTIHRLDLLNVLLVFYTLMTVVGLMIGGKIHDTVVGQKTFLNSFAAKGLGWVLGLLFVAAVSAQLGLLPDSSTIVYGILGIVFGTFFLFKTLPRTFRIFKRLGGPSIKTVDGTTRSSQTNTRFATELTRTFILSSFIFMWFALVAFAGLVSYNFGPYLVTVEIPTFIKALYTVIATFIGILIVGWFFSALNSWYITLQYKAVARLDFEASKAAISSPVSQPAFNARRRAFIMAPLIYMGWEANRYAQKSIDDLKHILTKTGGASGTGFLQQFLGRTGVILLSSWLALNQVKQPQPVDMPTSKDSRPEASWSSNRVYEALFSWWFESVVSFSLGYLVGLLTNGEYQFLVSSIASGTIFWFFHIIELATKGRNIMYKPSVIIFAFFHFGVGLLIFKLGLTNDITLSVLGVMVLAHLVLYASEIRSLLKNGFGQKPEQNKIRFPNGVEFLADQAVQVLADGSAKLDELITNEETVFLSPHPDDVSIAMNALLRMTTYRNKKVTLIDAVPDAYGVSNAYMTRVMAVTIRDDNDPEIIAMKADVRTRESIKHAQKLGLTAAHYDRLGLQMPAIPGKAQFEQETGLIIGNKSEFEAFEGPRGAERLEAVRRSVQRNLKAKRWYIPYPFTPPAHGQHTPLILKYLELLYAAGYKGEIFFYEIAEREKDFDLEGLTSNIVIGFGQQRMDEKKADIRINESQIFKRPFDTITERINSGRAEIERKKHPASFSSPEMRNNSAFVERFIKGRFTYPDSTSMGGGMWWKWRGAFLETPVVFALALLVVRWSGYDILWLIAPALFLLGHAPRSLKDKKVLNSTVWTLFVAKLIIAALLIVPQHVFPQIAFIGPWIGALGVGILTIFHYDKNKEELDKEAVAKNLAGDLAVKNAEKGAAILHQIRQAGKVEAHRNIVAALGSVSSENLKHFSQPGVDLTRPTIAFYGRQVPPLDMPTLKAGYQSPLSSEQISPKEALRDLLLILTMLIQKTSLTLSWAFLQRANAADKIRNVAAITKEMSDKENELLVQSLIEFEKELPGRVESILFVQNETMKAQMELVRNRYHGKFAVIYDPAVLIDTERGTDLSLRDLEARLPKDAAAVNITTGEGITLLRDGSTLKFELILVREIEGALKAVSISEFDFNHLLETAIYIGTQA